MIKVYGYDDYNIRIISDMFYGNPKVALSEVFTSVAVIWILHKGSIQI